MNLNKYKSILKISNMRFLTLLIIISIPAFLNGQVNDSISKTKKEVGQQTLTIDIGLFHDMSHFNLGSSQGFILGVEKRRQKLYFGLTFGKSIYYTKPNQIYGLTGFLADYSFIFFQPVEKFSLAFSAQFQYNYQDRVTYYEPPSETLILSRKYQESFFGLFGLEARVNIFNNLSIFGKFGLGIESRKSQAHYPYYPPLNKFKQRTWLSEIRMIGITYGFPLKKKLP